MSIDKREIGPDGKWYNQLIRGDMLATFLDDLDGMGLDPAYLKIICRGTDAHSAHGMYSVIFRMPPYPGQIMPQPEAEALDIGELAHITGNHIELDIVRATLRVVATAGGYNMEHSNPATRAVIDALRNIGVLKADGMRRVVPGANWRWVKPWLALNT